MTPLRTIGLQALSILVCGTAFAQSPRPPVETIQGDPFAAMEQFARCIARLEVAAEIARNASMPAGAEEYMGASRGARVAANFFAVILETSTDSKDVNVLANATERRMKQVENFCQLELNSPRATSERGAMDEAGFKYCFELQPLQVRTIEIMRREGFL